MQAPRSPARWAGPARRLVSPRRSASLSPSERRPSERATAAASRSPVASTCIQMPATAATAAAAPRADAKLGAYPADCGAEHCKHLSRAKAERARALSHAMRLSATQLDAGGLPRPEPWPLLATDMGAHSVGRHAAAARELEPREPLSVALYFRFLKAMSWLFLLLAALSAPALAVYAAAGGGAAWREARALAKQDPTAALALASLGHLKEASSVCDQAAAGATLALACPAGAIGFVKALYSAAETQGTCACPERQRVADASGACRGAPDASGACPAGGMGCFLGAHPVSGGACCSFALDEQSGRASFDAIRVRSRAGCGSRSAQAIVEGLCLGRAGCSIAVDEALTYSWVARRGANGSAAAACPDGASEARGGHADAALGLAVEPRRCEAALAGAQGSDFSQCAGEPRALLVFARCFATRVTLSGDWDLAVLGLDSISRRGFLSFAVACDVAGSAVFFLALRWLRRKEKQAVARAAGSSQIKARDYTVQLHKLPPHRDLRELRSELETHLENLLSAAPAVSVALDRVRIADIQFGQRATSARLDVLRRRGDVVRALEATLQRLDKLQQLRSKAALATEAHALATRERRHARERERLERRLARLDARLERLVALQLRRESSRQPPPPAVTAYVTFEEEEGVLRCLREYPELGALHRLVQPAHKRLRGKRLRFRPAPDPSDIIWENLHHSYASRVLRQLGAAVVTLAVLLVSFSVIFLTNLQQAKLERELGSPTSCPVDGVTREDVALDEQHKVSGLAPYKGIVECFCRHALTHESFFAMLRERFAGVEGGAERFYCREWAAKYATTRGLAAAAVLTVVAVNMLLSSVLEVLVGLEKHHTQSSRVVSRVTKVFLAQLCNTAVLLVALNANVDYFLSRPSRAAGSGAYSLSSLLELRVSAREVFTGKYADFSPGWYSDVGVALLLTALTNAVSPHAWAFGQFLVARARRVHDRGLRHWRDASRSSCATQRDLEALYRDPPFDLASRYAEALTSIFMAYLFSAGMPLMHLVGLFAMVATFWADKFIFLRAARLPPALDGRVAAAAGGLLPYAVLLHCLVALWMFSNARIFQSDDDVARELGGLSATTTPDGVVHYDGEVGEGIPAFDAATSGQIWERVTQPQVLVLLAFLLVLALVLLLRAVLFRALAAAGRTLLPCMARALGFSPSVRRPRGLPNYFDAIPTETLVEKLAKPHVLLPRQALRDKYERALRSRKQVGASNDEMSPTKWPRATQRAMSGTEHLGGANWIVGCPSYAISDNKEYVAALAIDSHLSEQLQLDQLL